MADELKTVGGEPIDTTEYDSGLVDPLLREQMEQAAQMRAALLTCRTSDITSAKVALKNISVLQIYHQVGRIIRFTEQMDRLEDKIYDSMDMCIGSMESADPATLLMLVKIQGDLQKTMTMSWDLLKPYMNIDLDAIAPPVEITEDNSFGSVILPKESRTAIRNGAQALLTELRNSENLSENEATDNNDGNSTADTQ